MVKEPIVLEFKIPDMSEQTILDQLHGSISLFDTHMETRLEFYCNELSDDTSIWEKDVLRAYTTSVLKSWIPGCTMQRHNREDKWFITIYISGSDNLVVYFDTEKECRKIKDKIMSWLLQ